MRRFTALLTLAAGTTLVLTPVAAQERPRTARTAPALVGYVAAFKSLRPTISRLIPGRYTHLNIAFANPDATGRFVGGDRLACMEDGAGAMVTRAALKAAVADARAKGARVLASVAGGVIPGCSGDWAALLAPDKRAGIVAALVALADEFELDGIDVDIEGVLLTRIDKAGDYTPFVAALAEALRARGKLLTCATASYEGGMIPVASIPYFDLVNVMSYDAIGPTWGPAGAEHATMAGAERDLKLWLDRGVRPERLTLGVPFYGYGFGGLAPNWSYRDIRAQYGATADRADVIGRACAGCRYLTYNTPATLTRKAELASRVAGGVMVWEVSQDTNDHLLTRTVSDALRTSN